MDLFIHVRILHYQIIANLYYTTHLTIPVGTLPLVINSDVSPPGNHSIRVVANNSAQSFSYIISSTDQPTGNLNMYIYHTLIYILPLSSLILCLAIFMSLFEQFTLITL